MLWGSNVPQTRTPDAHFMTEARYKGTKVVVVSPDYSEASKFADLWLHPKQGTDAALAMAIGYVIPKEFHVERRDAKSCVSTYFDSYVRENTDLPFLVLLKEQDGCYVQDRFLRASDFLGHLNQDNNPDWKTVAYDEINGQIVPPCGSIGFRWGESGHWNIEQKTVDNQAVAVSQPLYSSAVARWQRYERHLESIFPDLNRFIDVYGYAQP
jgi:nitrate reductase alpha subunit